MTFWVYTLLTSVKIGYVNFIRSQDVICSLFQAACPTKKNKIEYFPRGAEKSNSIRIKVPIFDSLEISGS